MNISLDQEIKKDRQRDRQRDRGDRGDRDRNNRHRHDNHRNYNNRNRYNDRFNHRQSRQPRIVININNLHYSVTKQQLQQLCEQYGRVKNCRIQWDKMGRSNQKATVQYFNKSDAENALQKLKGTVFQDQKIQVELIQEDNMPGKRHDIRKNYGNRFKHNFRGGSHHRYK